jgi:hypothetical protein
VRSQSLEKQPRVTARAEGRVDVSPIRDDG